MARPAAAVASALRNVLAGRFLLAACAALAAVEILGRAFVLRDAVGADFGEFYAASSLLQAGRLELLDAGSGFTRVVEAVLRHPVHGFYPWPYPPTADVVAYPLAWLPLQWAFTVAMTAGVLLLVSAVARIVGPRRDVLSAALASPAVALAIAYGQLSLLAAAILGWGLASLSTSPALAGAILALLAVKPQLGLLVPVALVAGRRWRAALAGAGAGIAFAAIAAAAFGWRSWLEFFRISRGVGAILVEQSATQHAFQSVVSAASVAGLSAAAAWAAQGVATLVAAAAVWWTWRGEASDDVKSATLVAATLLAVPHLGEYDLLLLAIPAAFLVRDATLRGWRAPAERWILVATWIVPAVTRASSEGLRVSLGPLVSGALLWLLVRRAAATRRLVAAPGTVAGT